MKLSDEDRRDRRIFLTVLGVIYFILILPNAIESFGVWGSLAMFVASIAFAAWMITWGLKTQAREEDRDDPR